jgi:HK97 family phage prohead protease
MKNKKWAFDFQCKGQDDKGDLHIEGFANRAMKGGGKVIDRGKEHIPAAEWSIDEWKQNPIIFFNHNRDMPIGQGVGAKVTDDGLWIKAKISNSKDPEISRVRDLIQEGVLKTFSVGIDVEDEEVSDDKSITLKGVNLLETSVVTIPMNQESFFSVSQKMLKEESVDQLASKILKAKGAWVAASIHQRIYEMQAQDPDFNRADALVSIAGGADISQGELMEMLAGNTAMFPEDVLGAVATVLGMDIDALDKLNQSDLALADADASLNPDEELEEEEIAEEESSETGEDDEEELAEEEEPEAAAPEADESSEDEPAEEPEADEDFLPEEDDEEEDAKQAEQGVSVGSPDQDDEPLNEPKLPMVGEVDDESDMQEAIEDAQPESGASKEEGNGEEGEEGNAFQACVSDKVRKLLDEGKPQDQALAIAISSCEGKSCSTEELSAEDWHKIFQDIAAWKQKKEDEEEEKKQKAEGDDSNGPTAPLNVTEQIDLDLGQPGIAAQQQTNILLGQLIAEMQKNNKLISEMMNMKVTNEALNEEEPEEVTDDDELLADADDEESQEESSKQLDITDGYREKLEKKLARLNC